MSEPTTIEALPTPVPPAPAPGPGMFGTKVPTSTALIIGVLVFLLPFLEIRCNNMTLKSVSGVELATGFQIDAGGTGTGIFDNLNNSNKSSEKKDGLLAAQIALLLGVIGVAISFANFKAASFGTLVLAVLAAASLIWLFFDVRRQVHTDLSNSGSGSEVVNVSVDFTGGFYVAIIAFIAAAYFSYRKMKVV